MRAIALAKAGHPCLSKAIRLTYLSAILSAIALAKAEALAKAGACPRLAVPAPDRRDACRTGRKQMRCCRGARRAPATLPARTAWHKLARHSFSEGGAFQPVSPSEAHGPAAPTASQRVPGSAGPSLRQARCFCSHHQPTSRADNLNSHPLPDSWVPVLRRRL